MGACNRCTGSLPGTRRTAALTGTRSAPPGIAVVVPLHKDEKCNREYSRDYYVRSNRHPGSRHSSGDDAGNGRRE